MCGGSGREITLRRNRSALERIALWPRVLAGVDRCDLTTTFVGRRIGSPVLLAPIGEIVRFHPDGALACGRAAGAVGSAAFVSAVSSPALEEVRAGTPAPLAFQIYVFGDHGWVERLVRRAEAAGFDAICLTVDTPVSGRLDRDLRNRITLPPQARPNLGTETVPGYCGGSLTWRDVEWLRAATRLPLVLKGIMHPADAVLAVEHGIDAIVVSNHGGRQLDDAPSTIEVLPEIVAAAAGRLDVLVDSGFTRGTDVVKALALGASGVLIGKLMVLALAAGGEPGLQRAHEILTAEITTTMINLGVGSIGELGPQHIRSSGPADGVPS